MSEAHHPASPLGENEPLRSEAEWNALHLRVRELHDIARQTRAEARELVARCVEARLARQDGRAAGVS